MNRGNRSTAGSSGGRMTFSSAANSIKTGASDVPIPHWRVRDGQGQSVFSEAGLKLASCSLLIAFAVPIPKGSGPIKLSRS